jgi:pSer/pThr/pTyr-binding forkhead associated (FHA) protein
MDVSLKVLTGPAAGQTIPVPQGKFLIGREDDCQFRPQSGFVSRHHCVLLLDEYTLRVRDLGSQNGTFINGQRIAKGPAIILHGDVISVGDLDFQVALLDAAVLPGPLATSEPGVQTTEMCNDQTVGDSQSVGPTEQAPLPQTDRQPPAFKPSLGPSSSADDTTLLPPKQS